MSEAISGASVRDRSPDVASLIRATTAAAGHDEANVNYREQPISERVFSPRPACGERSKPQASGEGDHRRIRSRDDSPSPQPSPRRRGEGEVDRGETAEMRVAARRDRGGSVFSPRPACGERSKPQASGEGGYQRVQSRDDSSAPQPSPRKRGEEKYPLPHKCNSRKQSLAMGSNSSSPPPVE
jgi:hypothetical protein